MKYSVTEFCFARSVAHCTAVIIGKTDCVDLGKLLQNLSPLCVVLLNNIAF